ncbi:hypothetical protein ACDN41_12280 [Priestia aryabhattai]|uniref:hypothetical protein n=1 Tax=Priestia aryabhattai TaxID=412384 RepID=UPI0035326ACB
MSNRDKIRKMCESGMAFPILTNTQNGIIDKTEFKKALEIVLINPNDYKIDYSKYLSRPLFKYAEVEEEPTKETPNEIYIKEAAKRGWTPTESTNIYEYAKAFEKYRSLKNYDKFFMKLYDCENTEAYQEEKKFILDNITSGYKILIEQCFENYENGHYHITIPPLISLVDFHVATLMESKEWGCKLFNQWESKLEQNKDHYMYPFEYETYTHIRKNIFGQEKRGRYSNRNKIMHGKDNPKYWKESYALKLFINISSLLTLIRIHKESSV